jgi:hypothetical protein
MPAKPNRKPGSNRGRPAIDWEAAFAFYASLPAERRSYVAVANEFGVSARTVEAHGRRGSWKLRLRQIETEAAAVVNASLGQARAEQVSKLVRLVDATYIAYAEKLRAGDVRLTAADLERLHKLWSQLHEEIAQPSPPERATVVETVRSPEHTAAVIEALRDAGVLDALGLQLADDSGSVPAA